MVGHELDASLIFYRRKLIYKHHRNIINFKKSFSIEIL